MPFRVREDARSWFSDIRGELTLDFDIYYFCCMAGIAAKRKMDASDAVELTDTFPERHRPRSRVWIALFLSSELQALGVDTSEKHVVHTEISRLIQPDSSNYLSDEGMREFNRYAHGGYDVLREWFKDKPRSLHVFLRMFKECVDEAMSSTAQDDPTLSEPPSSGNADTSEPS